MYVCPIPITLVITGIAIINATYRYRSGRLGHTSPEQSPGGLPNRALLNTLMIRSGLTTPSTDVTTIARPTSATFPRYGRNVATTRDRKSGGEGRLSSSAGTRIHRP